MLDAAIRRADVDTSDDRRPHPQAHRYRRATCRWRGLPSPAQVPDGVPLATPEGTPNETVLLLYQRNAILNEIQRRQSDYGEQIVLAAVPAGFAQ